MKKYIIKFKGEELQYLYSKEMGLGFKHGFRKGIIETCKEIYEMNEIPLEYKGKIVSKMLRVIEECEMEEGDFDA